MKAIKFCSANNWLLAIRNSSGLNQEQMAGRLGIKRTAYAMAELGKRSLPTAALLTVIELEKGLVTQSEPNLYDQLHPAEQSCLQPCRLSYASLFSRSAVCTQKSKLQSRLHAMKQQYIKTRKLLAGIENAISACTDEAALHKWRHHQELVIKTLQRCSLPEQILLQCRIGILEAEAEFYKTTEEKMKATLPGYFLED